MFLRECHIIASLDILFGAMGSSVIHDFSHESFFSLDCVDSMNYDYGVLDR